MRDCLIWSLEHGAWWRPARYGYTVRLDEAGLYTRAEAHAIVENANLVTTNECIIPAYCVALDPREE